MTLCCEATFIKSRSTQKTMFFLDEKELEKEEPLCTRRSFFQPSFAQQLQAYIALKSREAVKFSKSSTIDWIVITSDELMKLDFSKSGRFHLNEYISPPMPKSNHECMSKSVSFTLFFGVVFDNPSTMINSTNIEVSDGGLGRCYPFLKSRVSMSCLAVSAGTTCIL